MAIPIAPTQEQLRNRLAGAGQPTLQGYANANPENFDRMADSAGWTTSSTPSPFTATAPRIDLSQLGSTTPFTLPTAPTAPSYDLSTLPGLDSLLNPTRTPAQTAQDALGEEFKTKSAKVATKTAAQAQAEIAAGVPEFSKQLNDINFQIRDLQTQAVSAFNKSEDRLAPTFAIRGEQAQIERQRSVKALGLSAIAQALQGNVALAQSQADRAVEIEFGPLEAEIKYLEKALELNDKKLDRDDKKRAEALTVQLAERTRLLSEQKEDKKIIYGWAAEAAKNGASTLVINRALAAANPGQALTILGEALSDPIAKQQALADLQLTRAQINKTNKDAEAASTSTGVDAANLIAYAQQYASTGTIPTGLPKGTFGAVAALARELPKPEGALIDSNTGTKPAISDAKIDGIAALYDISKKVEQLKELDKNRWGGVVAGSLGKVFGSDAQQRYVDLRGEIVDLLARARTGAALTINEEKFYANQLPGRLTEPLFLGPDSQGRIDNFATKITGTLDTKLKAQQAVIVGFSKVEIGGQQYTVGQTVTNDEGQVGRVNADGTITVIQ